MLRNRLLPLQQAASGVQRQLQLHLTCKRAKSASSSTGSTNATRQSKILGKLFGSRVAGTKRRWYPSQQDAASGYQPPSVVFQASQFGKSHSNGSKNSVRRVAVLNKLFMTHITDLLATGEASDSILGRGLQVTRVKIAADFATVSVYWLGTGQLHNDAALDVELQRCSGQLRHELSQLRLMGEVPRIRFVRDKTTNNINSVEGILRTLNLSRPDEAEDGEQQEEHALTAPPFDAAQTVRQEFYGNAAAPPATSTALPEMRHDVLGLDRRLIMDKILTKMRKSKSAWEQHQQHQQHQQALPLQQAKPELSAKHRQLAEEAATSNNDSKFEAFLAKRRERKQTPERKKHRRELEDHVEQDYDELQALTPEQRKRYTEEDYILEDPHETRGSRS